MFGKAKIQNANVWKSQNIEFQCLEKPKHRISIFGKAKKQSSKKIFRIPMFGNDKIQNSNDWKSHDSEF